MLFSRATQPSWGLLGLLLIYSYGSANWMCSAQTVILPYGSGGYRYTTTPPAGWFGETVTGPRFNDPAFDDSTWSTGTAPFGRPLGDNCNHPAGDFLPAVTEWPFWSEMWIRKSIPVPSGARNLTVTFRHDDAISMFLPPGWQATSIRTSAREACGPQETVTFPVPASATTLEVVLYGAWTRYSPGGFVYSGNYVDIQVKADVGLLSNQLTLTLDRLTAPPKGSVNALAKMLDQRGQPVSARLVTFSSTATDVAISGHKLHQNLISPPTGNYQTPSSQIANSCTTDTAGQCWVQYIAPEVGGLYKLTASSESSIASKILPVQIEGLSELGRSSDSTYDLSGQWGEPGVNSLHDMNHYGSADLVKTVPVVAAIYNYVTLSGKLRINDMSLPLGGVFDIENNWTSPHKLHRNGRSVDINTTQSDSRPVNKILLRGIFNMFGMHEVHEATIHFELD